MFGVPEKSVTKRSLLLQTSLFGLLLVLMTIGASGGVSGAQTTNEPDIWVEDAVVAKGIEDLKPVEPGTEFGSDVGKLYFYTRIRTKEFPITVKHLWFQGDKFVMEINLLIKSGNWRTYSSKTIHPFSRGEWKVDVTTDEGTLLKTLRFTIQ